MKLENFRHEAFARGLAAGKSQTKSYADAGYSGCRQSASRLSAHADIQQRVQELKEQPQPPIKIEGRDPQTGQFIVGHSGNGGRPKGSRNKLATEFIDAVYQDFQKNGAEAIKKVATEEPAQYLRLIAQVLPKELDIALNVNSDFLAEVRDFHAAYQMARQYIGADSPLIDVEATDVEATDMIEAGND